MKTTLLLFSFFFYFFGFTQSKKEQIEVLNFSIDSLNKVVLTERKVNQDQVKEIEELTKKDLANHTEISQLKKELSFAIETIDRLKSDLEKANICNQFWNYSSYTSLSDLNKLQSCIAPNLTKSEFYKYYYEVFLLKQLRSNFNLINISDIVLLQLLKERRNSLQNAYPLGEEEKTEIVTKVISLDRIFVTEKYNSQYSTLSELFIQALFNHYFAGMSDEYNIEQFDNYVVTFYNLSGAGSEANQTKLYQIKNNSIEEINLYAYILEGIGQKMVKHFGKDCRISSDFSLKKINNSYEVSCTVYKAYDPDCCGSGYIKFTTSDFLEFDINSLMYGYDNGNNSVNSWKRY
jgi:hypothetical protein